MPAREPATPSLLRLLLVLTVLTVVLFTGAAVGSLVTARGSLTESAGTAEQIGRLQRARVELQRTDARATQHLLAGNPGTTSPDYRVSLTEVRGLIIDAADAQPADRPVLREVNATLDEYTTLLERARLSHGNQAGTAALTAAADVLRTGVESELAALVTAHEQRLESQAIRLPVILVAITGGLAVIFLLGTAAVVLVRFRRVINPGLTAAVVLVAVSFGVAVTVLSQADTASRSATQINLPILRDTADAQRLASEARASESLLVLTRAASGSEVDRRWTTAADEVSAAVARIPVRSRAHDLPARWQAYVDAHDRVRTAAAAGRWDEARELTTDSRRDSAGRAYAAFDAPIYAELDGNAAELGASLVDARRFVTVAALLTLLGGVGAVAFTIGGIRSRLREYA